MGAGNVHYSLQCLAVYLALMSLYWATVCKTARPMLSVRCLSVLSVCNVRALLPNGWTDQDETWHAGRPRPCSWPHCVRWGPSSPSPRGHSPHPTFGPYLLRPNGWIKMPLGMEVGLSPGDFVLDWDPPTPLNFRPMSIIVIVISLEHCICKVIIGLFKYKFKF